MIRPNGPADPVAFTVVCSGLTVHILTHITAGDAYDAARGIAGRPFTLHGRVWVPAAVIFGSPPPGPWAFDRWLPGPIPAMP